MARYYIAHRLFAAHDRALAATLAHRLAEEHGPGAVFLPFCDTDEENLIAATSDFLTYGPTPDDPAHFPFPDPLLTVAATTAVIRTHRLGAAPHPASTTYADFLTQNLATVNDLIDQTVRAIHRPPRPPAPFPALNGRRRTAYVEPSPMKWPGSHSSARTTSTS
ncbi:hypothetical protein [Actinomadura sp. WAC 06369]|uniref:hypothetical protein n=1 Tax=Actinomadura sp. WAC 06369 TaxID=2203193 RepID=UPI000F77A887|nr:hypothetical protein [Actinomadura sp. WAC 06369]RSN45417.1 hypothetical protein DMH08_36650 [Actinomadura sp. WAC 06369]